MYKKLVLFLCLFAALAANVLAQHKPQLTSGPNDVTRLSGLEAELARFLESDDEEAPDPLSRPRFIKSKAASVKSSVMVNTAADERVAFEMINRIRQEHGLQLL